MLLIRDQRAVYINRHLPAEGLVEPVVFRGGRQIFIPPHHMGDPHQMVVHHIGKIIGRIAVRFDQDHIVQLRILHRDISVDLVVEHRFAFRGVILSDHIGHTSGKLFFHLLFVQGKTMLIIDVDLLPGHGSCQARQPLFVAETIISLTLFDQLFRVFQVQSAFLSLALYVRPHTTVLIRPLIVDKACLFQRPVDDIHSPFHKPFLIGILNTENKISALMLGDQVGI